jgi:hypothetical protein
VSAKQKVPILDNDATINNIKAKKEAKRMAATMQDGSRSKSKDPTKKKLKVDSEEDEAEVIRPKK